MEKTFEQWMVEVNIEIANLCGMTADDIEDFCYWDAWDDGISPKSTARDALENSGF